jgi:hypothetical protein
MLFCRLFERLCSARLGRFCEFAASRSPRG